MFAVTNIDDVVLLALYFGRADGVPGAARRVVAGQYAGFSAILALSLLGATGVGRLEEATVAYVGLVPLALGVRAAFETWRDRQVSDDPGPAEARDAGGPTFWAVASVTLANGGDNVGVYVPVFAAASAETVVVYVSAFLLGVAGLCAMGRTLAGRPVVARGLARRGHVLLPVVLVAIGLAILIEGDAFGV